MPKLRPETIRHKAQHLTNLYIESGLKKNRVAKKLGTSRQNITEQINKQPVQDCINEMLDDPKFKQAWIEQGLAGMGADKSIQAVILVNKNGEVIKADDEGGIMIADHNARHKYWHDFGVAMKIVKPNGNGNGVKVINIIHAYDRDKSPISPIRS